MKPILSNEQRSVLLLGLSALIVLMVYGFFVLGFVRRASQLNGQVKEARQQVGMLEAALANEAAVREQYQHLDETVAAMRKVLPSEDEVPAVIETLSQLAGQSQVKILTIFPQRPLDGSELSSSKSAPAAAEAGVTKEVMIQVDALGGYHQLGMFLSLVESGEKPMQLASLRVSSDPKEPKRQRIKLLVRALFAVSQSATPTPQATREHSS